MFADKQFNFSESQYSHLRNKNSFKDLLLRISSNVYKQMELLVPLQMMVVNTSLYK